MLEGGNTQMKEAAAVPEHVAVDVAKLAASLRQKLGSLHDVERRPSIYRVIPSVRREDSAAYDPKLISIGPFHRDNKGLGPMEELKRQYLRELLKGRPESKLDDAIAQLSARVQDIRREYSEEFKHITDEDFVEMMVLDGCFILQLMIKLTEKDGDCYTLSFPGGKWSLPHLVNDLLLLENQIPYFVLETLFEATAPHRFTLLELAHSLGMDDSGTPLKEKLNLQILHLLHLYHHYQVSRCVKEPPPSRWPWRAACHGLRMMRKMVFSAVLQLCFRLFSLALSCLTCSPPGHYRRSPLPPWIIPRVTVLKEAGVRFKRREFTSEDSYSYLNVTFSADGVFEIPFLMLHGASNAEFRNLIAFEQSCHMHNVGNYITSYCSLMFCLVDKESDVETLEENGIICNFMNNSSEVALLFDKVVQGSCIEVSYYAELLAKVNQYCEADIHRWRARLMRDYFSNPWTFISLVAAAVLLGLTIVQTYYTIMAYHHPR